MIHITGEDSTLKFIFRKIAIFFGWFLLIGYIFQLRLALEDGFFLFFALIIFIITLSLGLFYIHYYKYEKLKLGYILIILNWLFPIIILFIMNYYYI